MTALQNITANLKASSLRYDEMEGREYVVCPMVMLTEGVHRGSNGPLYYPKGELSKTPAVWNYKPVVVYHPTMNGKPISACDKDVIERQKVGLIMNTTWDKAKGKLRAEAWLEKERLDAVDERILEAVENETMMEVSTGVFTDNERTSGEWNGEKYEEIARNYRADHLALLPDLKGACSIEDGAGLLQINEMSHDTIRMQLASSMRETHGDELWVMDVFSEYFIFEMGGKFFRLSYKLSEDDTLEVSGETEEVRRETVYKTVKGEFLNNSTHSVLRTGETAMKKTELVDSLIANEATQWEKSDRKFLLGQDITTLKKFEPVANEDEEEEDDDASDQVEDDADDLEEDAPKNNTRQNKKKVRKAAKKGASELNLNGEREKELSDLGFLPLVHYKSSNYAVFIGGQTTQKPKTFTDPDAGNVPRWTESSPDRTQASCLYDHSKRRQRLR